MSADTTPKIPDTFCPAKWDELYVSFEVNYAYSCCKSTPTHFTNKVIEIVSKERQNLLNGIQDASCSYCWQVEHNNGKSLRHRYLESFDASKFDEYKNNNKDPSQIQVTIGNECNFQCTYCNPKFSSKWEHDVRKKPYATFSDRYFWGIDPKSPDVMEKNIEFLKSFDKIERLSINGGEPLLNKKFFELLNSIDSDVLQFTTNLSAKKSVINKVFKACEKYTAVVVIVSIDATGPIAEFTRFGLNFDEFDSNFRYLLNHRPPNLKVIVNSVMSSVTVRDIENFGNYMKEFLGQPRFEWRVEYCKNPTIQSMVTLPDQYKEQILLALDNLSVYNVWGLDTLRTVIQNTNFSRIKHQELKHFLLEFANRKNIKVPLCLD